MKAQFFSLFFAVLLAQGCATPPESQLLFNGNDLTGWRVDVPAMDTSASLQSPFFVRNNFLVSAGEPQGHLITDAVFQN